MVVAALAVDSVINAGVGVEDDELLEDDTDDGTVVSVCALC